MQSIFCPSLSLVVPVYNESESLPRLFEEILTVLGDYPVWELICVDDGSSDGSFDLMTSMAQVHPQIKAIRLRRNYGQTSAMSAGFDAARHEVIVTLDADLQNDPRDIPALLEKIGEGYDVVSGWRRDRKDRMLSRRLPSVIANGLISRLTDVHLNDYGCTLKAYRRTILNDVTLYGELHRFVPVLASIVGGKVVQIPVNHRARQFGVSKYGIGRTTRVVLDLLTVKFLLQYATRPMQLFGKWGLYTLACAFCSGFATLYMKVVEDFSMNRNPLFLLTALLLFGGVQFLLLGLLGEMVTRTYHESQGKAIYHVAESLNLHGQEDS